MRGLRLGLGLTGGAKAPPFSVSFTGLSTDSLGAYGQVGNHAAISYTITPDLGTETVKWSNSSNPADAATFGTGASPTDFTSVDGFNVYLHVTDDPVDDPDVGPVTRSFSFPVRYAPGAFGTLTAQSFATGAGNQTYVFDAATGSNLTWTYSLVSPPSGVTIVSATRTITFDTNALAVQSGTSFTVRATDQYGRAIDQSTTFTITLAPAIFLLAGQSNMTGGNIAFDSGAGYPAGTKQWGRYAADDGVLVDAVAGEPLQHWDIDEGGSFPNNGKMGIANQFAIDYNARTGRPVIFVPAAKGNTGFGNGWNPNGTGTEDDLYVDAVARANACIAAVPGGIFEGVLWHQGEYEASAGNPTAHRNNLIALVEAFRTDITGAEDCPFILGGLLPEFVTSGGYSATQTMLEGFPEYVAYTAFASSSGTTSSDGVHFNAASLRTMGARYDDALEAAALNVPAVPSVVLNLDATPSNTSVALAWDAPADIGGRPITDYVVRYRVTGAGSWTTFSDGISATTGATVTGLTNDVEYEFQVAAVNVVGEGAAATTTATPNNSLVPLTIDAYHTASFDNTTGTSSPSFSSVAIADGASVLVAVFSANFDQINSMTVGGVSATRIGSNVESGNSDFSFWIAEGVTGTSVTVSITMAASNARYYIMAAWSLPAGVTAADCTLYSATQSTTTFSLSTSVSASDGGAILAFMQGRRADEGLGTPTWTGVTERTAQNNVGFNAYQYGTADVILTANEASRTVSRNDINGTSDSALLVVHVAP